jgi:hypothetical protein
MFGSIWIIIVTKNITQFRVTCCDIIIIIIIINIIIIIIIVNSYTVGSLVFGAD